MTVDNPEPAEPTEPNPEAELGDAGKKALAAERARADKAEKALKALQAEAEERANAELTELERFKKEAEELRAANSKAELDAIRYAVALDKGIPANLAGRLQGTDRESIEADADALAELVTVKPGQVRPDPSQGPKSTVGKQTPGAVFAAHLADQLK
jgi:Xaa-Pro aminopeptidase